MNQPRRSAAGATADVRALDNQHPDAGESGLTRDRRTVDPGADDD
jgi:hypothetical protein